MNAFVDFFLTIRNSKFFNGLVIFVIIASALYAGISSYDIPAEYLYYLLLFDYSITVFFLIELVIRMVAERNLGKFFKDGWNIFTFLSSTHKFRLVYEILEAKHRRASRLIRY